MVCFKSMNNISYNFQSLEQNTKAATHRCFHEMVFCKYAAKLQQNTHAEVRFQ